jgi:hypothetical protein
MTAIDMSLGVTPMNSVSKEKRSARDTETAFLF